MEVLHLNHGFINQLTCLSNSPASPHKIQLIGILLCANQGRFNLYKLEVGNGLPLINQALVLAFCLTR